jgi:predicted TIM-barrel fold metal-dependent hydrolase
MAIGFDDLERRPGFFVTSKPERVTFLPEPERRARWCTLVSVDDHLVEPPHLFEHRLPARLQPSAPRVEVDDDGMEYWAYDGERHYKVGLNAVVGHPREELSFEPTRFDEMRRGAWDIDARVHDMDLNGVYASLNFPSSLAGFAGQRYQLGVSDPELALAVMRAANDWHHDEWAGTYPGRIIPCQVPWLLDPEVAAAEVRANAARGFRAMTFPELPERLGLPSLHTGYWDPLLAACEETGTVVCLHVGSSSSAPTTSSDAPADTIGMLFFGWAMFAAVDWLYSRIPVRYPGLRICLSEGGIGWVAGLLDRLDHVERYQHMYGT